MVREDAEASNADKPCTLFYYETSGLEVGPITAICHCIVDKTLNKGEINKADRESLIAFFDKYKSGHPQDVEAQKISSDDITAVAELIMEYERIGTDFLDLQMKSSEDEAVAMDKVTEGGIHAIVQFMRSRLQGAIQ
jgi:hypothetical protein